VIYLYPVCPSIKTLTTINQRDFVIIAVQDGFEPGYLYQSEELFDGLLVMGLDDSEIYKVLLTNIYFHPYTFKIRNIINLNIFEIGKSNNPKWRYARKGYPSSFVYNFYKTRALFFQKFSSKEAIVKIYQNSQEIRIFHNTNPNTVWNRISILIQFTGCILFGLKYKQIKSEIYNEQALACNVENWQKEPIMKRLFNYYLKKFIVASIEWKSLFINWQNQDSNLIELTTQLKKIYQSGYTIKNRGLHV
ncbi:15005_t:CDS:2, partial [Gigaspora margarita]